MHAQRPYRDFPQFTSRPIRDDKDELLKDVVDIFSLMQYSDYLDDALLTDSIEDYMRVARGIDLTCAIS